jgi:hypothetical protein
MALILEDIAAECSSMGVNIFNQLLTVISTQIKNVNI